MRQPMTGDDRGRVASAEVRVVVPEHPPALTPRAARALLKLLTSVHNMQSAAEHEQVRWDRTG